MCLIVFNWQPATGQLILAANRDEFFARPALPLGWWPDAPHILAGRDLQGNGTWLGLHRDGRFAALTNYRAPSEKDLIGPTRGLLVANFLREPPVSPLTYLAQLADREQAGDAGQTMRGYNLLAGDLARGELAYYSNRSDAPPRRLGPGDYGLSNALLDTPWPKVEAKKAALRRWRESARTGATTAAARPDRAALDALFDMMHDTRLAADACLPATGLTLERERALSAAYIVLPDYGTRCTTVLCCQDGVVEML